MGASTPHFALQIRNRIRTLIAGLPADHPARREGEREIARLDELALGCEERGADPGARAWPRPVDARDPSAALLRAAGARRAPSWAPRRLPRPDRPSEAPRSTGLVQDLMLSGAVPRIYERWWRPALGRGCKGVLGPGHGDEHRIARLLLALSPGDGVLDVACGTGQLHPRLRAHGRADRPGGGHRRVARPCSRGRSTDTRAAGARTRRLRARRRAGAAVPRRELRRRLLLRGAPPVRRSDARARSHDRGAHPGRADRDLHQRAAPLDAGAHRASRCSRSAAACGLFEAHELVDALDARGFADVRQRLTGMTQFVGARRAWE